MSTLECVPIGRDPSSGVAQHLQFISDSVGTSIFGLCVAVIISHSSLLDVQSDISHEPPDIPSDRHVPDLPPGVSVSTGPRVFSCVSRRKSSFGEDTSPVSIDSQGSHQ